MSIKTELKRLYTALCGGTTNKDGTAAIIGDIADNYTGGGGGGSLPEPGNIGNVLTSTADGWKSAAPPVGYEEYLVTFTFEESVTANKRVSEIVAAKNANKVPIAVLPNGFRLPLGIVMESAVGFAGSYHDGSANKTVNITLFGTAGENDDVWYKFVEEIPGYSGDKNGQVLGVKDGATAWVSPSALSNAPFIVHITQSGTTFSTTETVAEIAAAFTAGKAIQGRYHLEVSEGEPLVADVNAAVESFTNVNNGYVLTVSWHDDSEATKRLYLDMVASATTDVFTYTSNP